MGGSEWISFYHFKETPMNVSLLGHQPNVPWSKGRLIGRKLPLKLKEIWGASESKRSPLNGRAGRLR
jgi:hypothetical protein